MGIINNFINRRINKAIIEFNSRKTIEPTVKRKTDKKNFFIKAIGLINNAPVGRETLAEPEYDFEEIRRAIETDSYIKITLQKHSRLIYKAGYYLKSENSDAVEYLKTRFRIMSYCTDKPIDILYQEIADDVVKYSNAILVKKRDKFNYSGVKAKGLFEQDPIVGYFRVDPATIYVKRDEFGNILKYVQKVDSGKEKTYKKEDVIHIYIDRESSNTFGTPKIVAALEDIKLLRKLEGYVLAIVYRFAMPLFHFKIGKTEAGFQATDKEITDTKKDIENMSLDGCFVSNEKTEINVIGAEGSAINISQYLTYFENRVFSALDSSASMMGRGGAKQDADSMEAQSHDYIKYVQKVLSIFIENFILNELLFEGGFNPISNEKDMVKYIFNEINLDTKIKVENNEMLKYQSNVQTLQETRRNIGYKEDVDESQLYKNIIEVPAQIEINRETAIAQGDQSIRVAKATPNIQNSSSSSSNEKSTSSKSSSNPGTKSKTGNISNGKKKSTSPNKDVYTRNNPTNQRGTTSAKVKEYYTLLNEEVIRDKLKHKQKYSDFYDKLEKLKQNILLTDSDIDYLFSITKESLLLDINNLINNASAEGINQALADIKKKYKSKDIDALSVIQIPLDIFYDKANETIQGILVDMKKRISISINRDDIENIINALEYRFRFLIEYILPKAKWYSYLKIGQAANIKKAKINFGNSDDKNNHDKTVNVDAFSIDDIPAFHPFCDCTLKF